MYNIRMNQNLKNAYHWVQAQLAVILYGNPSNKLKVIGVTGTDGKTTTTSLIYHVLKENGKKVSMLSTVYGKVGDKEYDTGLHTTTPDPFLVQKLLKKAYEEGDEYFVLETTSHALDQHRVGGVEYEIGLITNITHEHLDYHKTYENYVCAKTKLLQRSKTRLVNRDDESYPFIAHILKSEDKKFLTFGLKKEADFNIDLSAKLGISLPEFNRYNYLAAYTVAWLLGIEEEYILHALKSFSLPIGRMETVYDEKFKVIVDFAHTPRAIREALKAVKDQSNLKGRLIHVFGSAGLRDQTKRPLMGDESGAYADIAIITEEDYRTEDPLQIAKQIANGLVRHDFTEVKDSELNTTSAKKYSIITNREDAIKKALAIAGSGDVIIITGKGHEKSLCRGKIEYQWSDQEAVKRLLAK